MAQQAFTQLKNPVKATVQKVLCVRIGREQHVPDSIACTQNQTSRVGVGCGAAHALRVQPTAPLHTLSKEKTHSLTLLPQNHLDHFNNLLLDLWYRNIHDLPNLCTSTRAVA